ncbi:MAG TPA: glycoside hydrolase family 27 protein [Propionibacteriaceae bacterium]
MTPGRIPPMGWNSWDCYGTTVTEAEVLANAHFVADHMLASGWDTIVVDIAWSDPHPKAGGYNEHAELTLSEHGVVLPAINRFPSAGQGRGFGPLAARVHDLGLRFGVHVMRGIPRRAVEQDLPVLGTEWTARDIARTSSVCDWNSDNYGLDHSHPGAQAYYDAQLAQFAQWGVDFVKADDMLGPYHADEIAAYARAIERTGRPIALSLSPGREMSLARLPHLLEHATMWRISDDLWDRWEDVYDQFGRLARWAPSAQPGHWPDADMLPVGRIGIRAERGTDRLSRLSLDEQRTLLSLWCLARSPLMVGCDLPTSPTQTIDLLTNDDVLDILRSATDNREVLREGDLVLWVARHADTGDRWVGAFWTGDTAESVRVPAGSVDLPPEAAGVDLWSGVTVGLTEGLLTVEVPSHGVRLLRFPA